MTTLLVHASKKRRVGSNAPQAIQQRPEGEDQVPRRVRQHDLEAGHQQEHAGADAEHNPAEHRTERGSDIWHVVGGWPFSHESGLRPPLIQQAE
ncbi:hypothetical protein [Burkholderia pyrrocinia]|uniref:hypothetical protein n=1 Tax=Burkholderia pyrrocinia TaxID=60550 RepID=UPI00158CB3D8|nr:hypothetical protein [Burkholderia pyrrocinia]